MKGRHRRSAVCGLRARGAGRLLRGAFGSLALLAALGCGSGDGGGADAAVSPDLAGDPGRDPGATDVKACPGGPTLRVVVLDAWARRLPAWVVEATPTGASMVRSEGTDPVLEPAPATVDVVARSEGLEEAKARVTVDPAMPERSSVTVNAGGALAAVTVGQDGACPRVTAWIGLDHPWFAASGRPPRAGNHVDLMMDGETTWAAVANDLATAEVEVRGTTWWWQSDFELTRPAGHETMSDADRRPRTVLAILDGLPATKRILVNRFLEQTAEGMAYLNTDPDLRERGLKDGDRFEVILQGSPVAVSLTGTYDGRAPAVDFGARVAASGLAAGEAVAGDGAKVSAVVEAVDAASYHQKGFVIDGKVAWVAGMNVKSTDWDTSEHGVFESRRMKFETGTVERQRVREKLQLPDLGPRKDYAARIVGPAARDVDDVLALRWRTALATGALYADHATPFDLLPAPDPLADGVTAQVVATLPPPIPEQSILETWAKALARAERFIYIEDQYFRMPILNGLIAKALQEHPQLVLVVVTKPLSISDGGKKYSVESDALFRQTAPDRYLLLQLKSFDAVRRDAPAAGDEASTFYFVDMDVHSKILVVDDLYLSVGSCNKNNRGLLYEGELDVSVLDGEWVRDQRRRIFRNLVGPAREGEVGDDPAANFVLLRDLAAANRQVESWWTLNGEALAPEEVDGARAGHHPDGFVYPLEFTPDFLLDVGPDAF